MAENGKTLTEINESLREYLQKGFNVPGSIIFTKLVDFMQPSIRVVTIDTNLKQSEIYPINGGKYGFGRPAIQKFVDAGRIELKLPPDAIRVERGKGVARYTAKVIGERYELDGSPKRLEDAKPYDLIIREEEMMMKYEEKFEKEHPNWSEKQKTDWVTKCVKKIMIEKHKFAAESAITGAQARVVQKLLGLKPAYTLEELKKPFVIVAVTPVVDMKDPDIKKMVTAHMLGIRETLYPHAVSMPSYQPCITETIDLSDIGPESDQVDATVAISGESAASNIVPFQTGAEDIDDYPRSVKENILRKLITDSAAADNLVNMKDEELVDLFVRLKAA
ncbi:MAG: hypothetical protein FJ240_13380 [Nitrospira sp.]|nr:hypothetical protein [Nitrospira sp.]